MAPVFGDSFFRSVIDEITVSVPQVARRIETVEQALQSRIGHRFNVLEVRFGDVPSILEQFFNPVFRSRRTPHQSTDLLTMNRLWERFPGTSWIIIHRHLS